uniref:Zona pellucida-like domain-containing protein 1 n=1 Tax=Ciona intestinalis TaxID=7719 RepID=F6QLP3_CIOIN|nr:zona pellucida-like domain-containing protein 1 [Ciona intestinalis]|eukprot:XP_002126560.1 zona pellucida-like domain-containing protein 1 [Ciona intestinalis]
MLAVGSWLVLMVWLVTTVATTTTNVQGNAFLELPAMDQDANVTCGGLAITVLLRHEYIARNRNWIGDGRFLSLKDRTCRAIMTSDGDAIFSVAGDFSSCGNTVSVTEQLADTGALETTEYKFSNQLVHEAGTGIVSRKINLFKFDCIYSANQRLSALTTSADVHVIKVENINGEMEVFKNITEDAVYNSAPNITSNQTVFIRVSVKQPPAINIPTVNFKFTTVIEKCWTTTTNVNNYTLVENGCPVDQHVDMLANGESLNATFGVQLFQVVVGNATSATVYCAVKLCNKTNENSCVPQCNEKRRKRSTEDEDREIKYFIESSNRVIELKFPIRRNEALPSVQTYTATTAKPAKNEGLSNLNIILLVSLTAGVIIIVATILCLTAILCSKNRRGNPKRMDAF